MIHLNPEINGNFIDNFLPAIILENLDYSLLTPRELQFFKIYKTTRKELSKKYPNVSPQDEDDTINIPDAKYDSKASLFLTSMTKTKELMEKTERLQILTTQYEKYAIRLYCKLVLNWHSDDPKSKQFLSVFSDSDICEIVESYFKIMRKYNEEPCEEPYYFLNTKQKRNIIHEGEMLKRTTLIDDSEIKISLLEEL